MAPGWSDDGVRERSRAEAGELPAMIVHASRCEHSGAHAEALAWFERAAEAGDASAMLRCAALRIERGEAVDAVPWLLRSAEAGEPRAVFVLLELARRGDLLGPAESKKVRGLSRSLPGGVLGRCGFELARYLYDAGGAGSWRGALAIRVFRVAASSGHARAMTTLAEVASERSPEQVEGWLFQAARAGDHLAMSALGHHLQSSGRRAEAGGWFLRSAEAGNLAAMADYGVVLAGTGPPGQAEPRLRRAADAGVDARSRKVYGLFLAREGRDDEAIGWLRRAAEGGSAEAWWFAALLAVRAGRRQEADELYSRWQATFARWPRSGSPARRKLEAYQYDPMAEAIRVFGPPR